VLRAREAGETRRFEIRCAACQEPRKRPLTTGPVSYMDLLVTLDSGADASACAHVLAFYLSCDDDAVLAALNTMQDQGLVLSSIVDFPDRTRPPEADDPRDTLWFLRGPIGAALKRAGETKLVLSRDIRGR
jgi:hypothetical protein